MTYVVEGWPKGVMEEVEKEKALKQAAAEASFNEKSLELNVVKRWAITAERAQELAELKAKDLQGKLNEVEVKLAKAMSLVSTHDKELVNLKETMKTCEQVYYNMGFKDVENSTGPMIFLARKFGFAKG